MHSSCQVRWQPGGGKHDIAWLPALLSSAWLAVGSRFLGLAANSALHFAVYRFWGHFWYPNLGTKNWISVFFWAPLLYKMAAANAFQVTRSLR